MKVLVIGANGQVGSELESELIRIAQQGRQQLQVTFSNRSQLDLADISKIAKYLNVIAPNIIVNASAYTSVDKAESQRDLAFLINDTAVKEMAIYCKQNNGILIHISTDYVFDGKADRAYVETDPIGPSGIYGASKLAGENSIREVLDKHIILRTSWVFGANGVNFVKTMLQLAEEKVELGIVADQFGSPTSARAIAQVICQMINKIIFFSKTDERWGTYHFSGFPFVSWSIFANEIFEQAVCRDLIGAAPRVNPISTVDYPTRAVRPKNSRLDCYKLKNTFGIYPDDWKKSLSLVLDELNKRNQK